MARNCRTQKTGDFRNPLINILPKRKPWMFLSNSANYFYRKRRIVLAPYLPCPPPRLHRGHCPSLNHPFPNASENLSNQLSFSTLSHHFGFWSSQCMCPLYGQVLFVKGVLLYLGLSNCLMVVVHGKKCFLWHASGLALRSWLCFLDILLWGLTVSSLDKWRWTHCNCSSRDFILVTKAFMIT